MTKQAMASGPEGAGSGADGVRLFRSDFLERLTHTRLVTLVGFWVPVFGACLLAGLWQGRFSPTQAIALVLAGVLGWTLLEYLLHRFVFHLDRWLPWARGLAFLLHGCHHEEPDDASRDVMPLLGSLPFFASLLVLAALLLGPARGATLVGALGLAYLAYDVTHYACHQWPMQGPVASFLKRHHLRHHYADSRSNFGVSSPLWDVVFGTLRRRARRLS